MLQIAYKIRDWTSEILHIACKTEGPGHSSGDPSHKGGNIYINKGHGTIYIYIRSPAPAFLLAMLHCVIDCPLPLTHQIFVDESKATPRTPVTPC